MQDRSSRTGVEERMYQQEDFRAYLMHHQDLLKEAARARMVRDALRARSRDNIPTAARAWQMFTGLIARIRRAPGQAQRQVRPAQQTCTETPAPLQ